MSAKICPVCDINLQMGAKEAKHLFAKVPDDNNDLPCFDCAEEEES